MHKVVLLENNERYYYCGWFADHPSKIRYPKYSKDLGKAIGFADRAYAIGLIKSLDGKVFLENVVSHIENLRNKIIVL